MAPELVPNATPLTELTNIGPTIAARLAKIRIHTAGDLRRIGPANAYRQLAEAHAGETLPVCYYLYSLHGALTGLPWDELSEVDKLRLRVAAGFEE